MQHAILVSNHAGMRNSPNAILSPASMVMFRYDLKVPERGVKQYAINILFYSFIWNVQQQPAENDQICFLLLDSVILLDIKSICIANQNALLNKVTYLST